MYEEVKGIQMDSKVYKDICHFTGFLRLQSDKIKDMAFLQSFILVYIFDFYMFLKLQIDVIKYKSN